MNIDRRQFLTRSLPALAGIAIAAEELAHPGRVIFLPARRSLADLWQEYVDRIRPIGLLATVEAGANLGPHEWVVSDVEFGHVHLVLSKNISSRTERQIRASILNPSEFQVFGTRASLVPWIHREQMACVPALPALKGILL